MKNHLTATGETVPLERFRGGGGSDREAITMLRYAGSLPELSNSTAPVRSAVLAVLSESIPFTGMQNREAKKSALQGYMIANFIGR